jgi:hypothetical protein
MQKKITQKISSVRIRLSVNMLLEMSRHILFWIAIVVLAAVLSEKLLAVNLLTGHVQLGLLIVGSAVLLVWWYLNRPTRQKASVLIDDRLRLKERTSSLLSLEDKDDLFARAACQEATDKIVHTDIKGHFPISLSKGWSYSVGMWIAIALLIALMPQYDLLGALERQKEEDRKAMDVLAAEKLIELTSGSIKLAVKQLGDGSFEKDLDKLTANSPAQSPEAIKRRAIQKLGALSDRIKQLGDEMNKDSLAITKKMLKQLRPMSNVFSQKLQTALSKGDFSGARDMIKQMQQQLDKGQMTEEQKKQMSEQLRNLAKQLEQIAARNKELEDALKKLGLDKKMAKLSSEDLKKMLQKQNLSPQQIDQLLQKMAACKAACKSCSGLGKAMAACSIGAGGLDGDGLSQLAAQLNDMEAFEQRVKMMQASLSEIENAMSCLGQGMCQGSGKGPWKPGQSTKYGNGSGGPGRGHGLVDKDADGKTSTKATKVQNKSGEGQIVASWYFKGEQIKGESSRELGQMVQAAKENAAESISNNEIPKRYEESVKNYFNGLEEEK